MNLIIVGTECNHYKRKLKYITTLHGGKKKSDSFQTNEKILLRKSFDGGPGTKYWQRSTKQNIFKKKNTEYSSNISNENKMEQKIKFMQSI